jgi:hypothetical protein
MELNAYKQHAPDKSGATEERASDERVECMEDNEDTGTGAPEATLHFLLIHPHLN